MSKPFKGIDHGTDKIDLRKYADNEGLDQGIPIEIHHKLDGDINNEPSFAIVFARGLGKRFIFGQLSLKMFNDGLKDIGYKIEKL